MSTRLEESDRQEEPGNARVKVQMEALTERMRKIF